MSSIFPNNTNEHFYYNILNEANPQTCECGNLSTNLIKDRSYHPTSIYLPKSLLNNCGASVNNEDRSSFSTGVASTVTLPLIQNQDYQMVKNTESPHAHQTLYGRFFGGYTIFEIFCLVIIGLSVVTVVILVAAWIPGAIASYNQPKPSYNMTTWTYYNQDDEVAQGKDEPEPAAQPPVGLPKPLPPPQDKIQKGLEIIEIRLSKDLYKISQATHTVTIQSLTDAFRPVEIPNNVIIKRLELVGPIGTQWLQFILTTFKSLQTIHVNGDRVSAGITKINTAPKTYQITSVESISVENSNFYKMLDWPLDLRFPALKKFRVSNSNLDKENFDQFKKIVSGSEETIEEIEITTSYICSKCDVSEVQFDNIRRISVTKRRDRLVP